MWANQPTAISWGKMNAITGVVTTLLFSVPTKIYYLPPHFFLYLFAQYTVFVILFKELYITNIIYAINYIYRWLCIVSPMICTFSILNPKSRFVYPNILPRTSSLYLVIIPPLLTHAPQRSMFVLLSTHSSSMKTCEQIPWTFSIEHITPDIEKECQTVCQLDCNIGCSLDSFPRLVYCCLVYIAGNGMHVFYNGCGAIVELWPANCESVRNVITVYSDIAASLCFWIAGKNRKFNYTIDIMISTNSFYRKFAVTL